ncbi:MAG: DUF4363 family protein [Eubacteriales bacterium]|nr:DUF4363 family protein [Eubacteriales bacterium]
MGKKIALVLLLILMLGGALLQNIYVSKATAELTGDLEKITSALNAGNHQSAVSAADTFSANWEKEKPVFEALFEHDEVDIISATAKSIQSLCISNETADALSEIAAASYYIDHIMEINSIRLENIF